jgi:SAM-dependent methyltransferase
VKEMMIGIGDTFNYLECSNCGVLQLIDIPKDLDKYYPDNYFSYSNVDGLVNKTIIYVYLKLYNNIIYKKSLIGKILLKYFDFENKFFSLTQIGKLVKSFIDLNILSKDSNILDIGCGAGQFLQIFEKMGFNNLYGVDIHIMQKKTDINFVETTLEQYETNLKFDLIFLKDSFEHMDNQLECINRLKELLTDNGRIILTIPLKSSLYKTYGSYYYDIDAPRHFYIHTLKSFKTLLNDSGIKIDTVIYDSTFMSYVRSEEYKNNIFGNMEKSYKELNRIFFKITNINESIFNKEEIREFKNKAKISNEQIGDHGIFVLSLR